MRTRRTPLASVIYLAELAFRRCVTNTRAYSGTHTCGHTRISLPSRDAPADVQSIFARNNYYYSVSRRGFSPLFRRCILRTMYLFEFSFFFFFFSQGLTYRVLVELNMFWLRKKNRKIFFYFIVFETLTSCF